MSVLTNLTRLWLLGSILAACVGSVAVKELVDPSAIVDLKIDKVRYGDVPTLSFALDEFLRRNGRLPRARAKLGMAG
jgi:hypothetical protein